MKNVGFAAVQRDPGPPKLVSVDADRIVLATLAKNVTATILPLPHLWHVAVGRDPSIIIKSANAGLKTGSTRGGGEFVVGSETGVTNPR
jgi:hypothetical protein